MNLHRLRYFGLLALALLAWFGPLQAETRLNVENAWVPEAPPVASVMACYMQLINPTDKPVTINTLSSPGFEQVEIHRTVTEGGLARMVKQDSLIIPAKDTVIMAPGGLHIMLIKPRHAYRAGDKVTLRLQLADGEKLTIHAPVRRDSTMDNTHEHHHH